MNRVLNTRGNFAKFLSASKSGTTTNEKNNLYKGELFVNLVNAKLGDGEDIICYEYDQSVPAGGGIKKVVVNRVNAGEIFVGTGIVEDNKKVFYKLNPVTALSFGNNSNVGNSGIMATAFSKNLKTPSLEHAKTNGFADDSNTINMSDWKSLIQNSPLFAIYQYTGSNQSYNATYKWLPETGDLFFFTSHELYEDEESKIPGDIVIIKSGNSQNIAACASLKDAYDLAVAGNGKYAASADDEKESPRDMQTIVTKILYNSMSTASKGRLWADLICKDLSSEDGIIEFLNNTSGISGTYETLMNLAGATAAEGTGSSSPSYEFNDATLKGPSTEFYHQDELIDLGTLASTTVGDSYLIPEIVNAYNGTVFYIDKEGFQIGGTQLHAGNFIYRVTDQDGENGAWVIWNESWIHDYIFSDIKDVENIRKFATVDATNHNLSNEAFYDKIVVQDKRAVEIKDYIKELYKVKADLDPDTHKLLVSQLPDAIFGGLHFAGVMSDGTFEPVIEDEKGERRPAVCLSGFTADSEDSTQIQHFFELANTWELAYHDSAVRKYLRNKIVATYGSDRDETQGGKLDKNYGNEESSNSTYEKELEGIIAEANGKWNTALEIKLLDAFKQLDENTGISENNVMSLDALKKSKLVDFLKGAYFIWSHNDSVNGHTGGPIKMYVDDNGYTVRDYAIINNDTDNDAGNGTPRVKYLTNGDWLVFEFSEANYVTKEDGDFVKTQMLKPITIVDAASTLESIKADGRINWYDNGTIKELGKLTGDYTENWEIFTTPTFSSGRGIALTKPSSNEGIVIEAPNSVLTENSIIIKNTITYAMPYFAKNGVLTESDLLRAVPKEAESNTEDLLALFGQSDSKNLVEIRNVKKAEDKFGGDFKSSTEEALSAIGAWEDSDIYNAVAELVFDENKGKLKYDDYKTTPVKDIRLPYTSGTLSTVEELDAAYVALATLIAQTYLKVVKDVDEDWIPTVQVEKAKDGETTAKRFINSYIKQHYGKASGDLGKFDIDDEALYGLEFNTSAGDNGATDKYDENDENTKRAIYFIGLNANLKASDLGVEKSSTGSDGVSIDLETAANFGLELKEGAVVVGKGDTFDSENALNSQHKYSLPYRGAGTSVLVDSDTIIDCGIWE